MVQPTAEAKVLNFAEQHLFPRFADWMEQLTAGGDLRQVEQACGRLVSRLSDVILSALLPGAARGACVAQQRPQLTKVVERPVTVRLRSGHQVVVPSLYAKRPQEVGVDQHASRHLMARHWSTIGGASPCRYDAISYAAVSLPSYDLSQCLLARHGVGTCTSGVRDLTNKVAEVAYRTGEAELQLKAGESLAGKRVVISSDGGRTLTRQLNGQLTQKGNASFDAQWREPKLFVIDCIDEEGRPCRQHLPIYGCRFSDTDHLILLRHYLERLEIDRAAEVQLIADGATWIWNKIPTMLEELGVKGELITQTLDYYHAAQHLEALFKALPAGRIGKSQRARWWKRCKEWLWQGRSRGIVRLFSRLYQRFPAAMRTELHYFTKHRQRMYYADYEEDKLLCGSGIIESAVRRVINLRYKNTSTFWDMATVEKLYFLRGAVLSKRWDVVMQNLIK